MRINRAISRAVSYGARMLVRAGLNTLEKRGTPFDNMLAQRYLSMHVNQGGTNIKVTEDNALTFAAVFASVRILSESKATLPIKLHERNIDGTPGAEVHQHDLTWRLRNEPTPDHTAFTWKEVRQAHACLWGNSFAEIDFDMATAVPSQIYPLDPDKVTVFRDDEKRIKYKVDADDRRPMRVLDQSQMLHTPGIGGNGIIGWSVVRLAANTVGIGLQTDNLAAEFFGNGARQMLIAEHPGQLGDTAYTRLKESISDQYSREQKNFILFEGGLKPHFATMPLREAQFLESRKFQSNEIATRWFRIPETMVGLMDNATLANVSELNRWFERHTMAPWLIRDEQEMERKLLTRAERERFRIKHNVDALLRSDVATRFAAHKDAIMTGFKTINEVRHHEDLEPLEGGDRLVLPEAIFGKQEGHLDETRSDPRLRALAMQTVEGLLERERTHAKRAANKPDTEYRSKISEFYDKHADLVRSKLSPIFDGNGELIERWVRSRQEMLAASSPDGVAGVVGDWHNDAATLVDSLIGEDDAD